MGKKKNKQYNNSKKTDNNDIDKNEDNNINKNVDNGIDKTEDNDIDKNVITEDATSDIEIENSVNNDIPHMSDFMGNGNDVFTTYKNKYENTMSSAIILLFFGVLGIMSTIGILIGVIDLPLSTFQHIFLTTLYVIFFVYGIISFFKAMDYKEKISTENTMEDTIDRYLENHITKEYIDSLHDESITEEENYVMYVSTIQESFMKDNPDFDKDLVEYHIDNFLNEHF